MTDRCPTNVYYEFHGMGAEGCPYPCQNKTEYGYCKTTGCINPEFDRTRTFTWYDPIEIARQYAPKFDKPEVEVAEVKHGRWITVSDGYGNGVATASICECSLCKDTIWVYKNDKRKWKFCPHCGATMDLDEVKE